MIYLEHLVDIQSFLGHSNFQNLSQDKLRKIDLNLFWKLFFCHKHAIEIDFYKRWELGLAKIYGLWPCMVVVPTCNMAMRGRYFGWGRPLPGRWNRGCDIPISRFQNDNIPAFPLNIQYPNFKVSLSYDLFKFQTIWYPDILLSVPGIQYPDFKIVISPVFKQYPISGFRGSSALATNPP